MPSSRMFRAHPGLQSRNFSCEMVWLDPRNSRLHRANETATIIYQYALEGKSEQEIIDCLIAETDGIPEVISRETSEVLDLFISEGILEEMNPK